MTGLVGVACAGQSSPPAAVARDARADLIWYIWSSNTNVRGEAYNAIVAHFQEQYPNVTVQQVTGGGNLKPILEKLITLVTAGEPLDVVGVRHDVLGQYVQMGLLKDLGPLTRREPGFKLSDHLPSAVEMLSFKGKQYALPIGMSTSAMAYNADILAREGVRPPDGSWDWKQFQELAQRLTARKDEGTQWGMHIPPTSSEIFPWVWMNGGEPFSPKEEPARATFSQAEVQEAVGWFTDLSTRYAVKAPWETPDGKATNGRFGEGRVAFFPVQSNNTRELQDRPFQWDIAPFPKGKRGQAVYPLSSFSYGVYGQTQARGAGAQAVGADRGAGGATGVDDSHGGVHPQPQVAPGGVREGAPQAGQPAGLLPGRRGGPADAQGHQMERHGPRHRRAPPGGGRRQDGRQGGAGIARPGPRPLPGQPLLTSTASGRPPPIPSPGGGVPSPPRAAGRRVHGVAG